MICVALAALLLERLLRLLGLAANPDQVISYLSQMMITLIPHYLGIALPLAFFLGVLITFNRLHRDNELPVITAAGIGLLRLMRPVMGLALLLTLIAAITSSFLQPLGRYTYRALRNTVAHASLNAALKDGTFVHIDGRTFIAEGTYGGAQFLEKVFVFEEQADGTAFVTTAEEGQLTQQSDGLGAFLILESGRRTEFLADAGGAKTLDFSQLNWPIDASDDARFRARGNDERELTLPELWAAAAAPPSGMEVAEIRAELHGRLVNVATLIVLPLLAVPLALGGGRGGQSYGIAVGLVALVVYEKLVQLGEKMADLERVSPWLGVWLPFVVLAMLGAVLTYRATFLVPRGKLRNLPSPTEVLLWIRRRSVNERRTT